MYRRTLLLLLLITRLQNAGAIDIPVVNNADSGNGTLRQAIQFNESLGGGNTILISNIVTGTITLTNILGELLITRDVTIIGPGAKDLAISGNLAHRVFHLTNNAAVSISGLTITAGRVSSAKGAGILQDSGSLTLSDCTITANVNISGEGGGISASGTVAAIRCTFAGNSAAGLAGAGIYTVGTLAAINCTFFNNLSINSGGGIAQYGGSLALTNCTIFGNTAFSIVGGGIHLAFGTATIRNTIIASNTSPVGPDCHGAFTSGGFNFVGAINGSTGWGALGDQFGTTNSYLNPWLGPLQDNGGPTFTMAPQLVSPVIDQGNSSGSLTDQRGRPRPYTNVSIGSIPLGGDRSDIGAYEISPTTLVVSNLNDSGPGSLRQAIQSAGEPDGDNITFASNVVGSIVLTNGELLVSKKVNILGPGAKVLTVSGNDSSRVFHVMGSPVLLADLTITRGTNNPNVSPYGGGIFNEATGDLTVSNCLVMGNSAFWMGAGIANLGTLFVYGSSIVSNITSGAGMSSGAKGGGIYNHNNSSVAIANSTISHNIASGGAGGGGGGIYNNDACTLYNSTVASNTVSQIGGGIYNGGSQDSVTLYNSIVANNSGGSFPDLSGPFSTSFFNLIGQPDGSTGLTNGVNDNQVGSLAVPLDARLGPLRDNGGPTPTHSLLPGSPANDHGATAYTPYPDQRGAPRFHPVFPLTTNATDIGAFELNSPVLSIIQAGNNAILSWPFYYGDFALQSVTNLPSTNWIAVPGTPMVIGNQYMLTNSPITGNKFYRLKSL